MGHAHSPRLYPMVACICTLAIVAGAIASDRQPHAAGDRLATLGQPDRFGGYPTDRIIVRLEPGVPAVHLADGGMRMDGGPIDALAAVWGVTEVAPLLSIPAANPVLAGRYGLDRTWVLHVPPGTDTPAMAAAFSALPGVEFAELDSIGGIAQTIPNDSGFGLMWGMHNTGQNGGLPDADIDAPEAWDICTGLAEVVVAELDTGIQADHPDLLGHIIPGRNVYDDNDDTSDPHGHGTHVAGTIGASGNNGIGVAGVNWNVKIVAVTTVSDGGGGLESHCAEGIIWAADSPYDVRIISMSLQYYAGTQTLEDAVNYAHDAGILLIAAAGNLHGNVVSWPAKFANCMGVSATNRDDELDFQSNYGPEIDVCAPGREIYSTWRLSGYQFNSGTSMATPHVSGLASLMLSYNNALSAGQLEAQLIASVDDLGPSGFDEEFGWGRINAAAALQRVDPRGDLNCDGVLDGADIDSFFEALADPAAFLVNHPDCDPYLRGDVNGDDSFDGADIDAFFTKLGG